MLKFRPHHFLCTLGFVGKGYSDEFVENFQAVADGLRKDPLGDQAMIEVVAHTDSICAPCPNKLEKLCATETKIQKLDAAHAEVLGFTAGDQLTWKEAKERMTQKMTDTAFDSACAPCSWKSMGVCHSALKKLREQASVLMIAGSLIFLVAPTLTRAENLPYVDTVQEQVLKKAPSKTGKALKKALTALESGNFASARSISAPLVVNGLFADYAQWITATAFEREAIGNLESKKFKKALENGKKAATLFLQIELLQPYSPLMKKLPNEIALAEFVVGDAMVGLGNPKDAQKVYERGLQRLSNSNSLYLLSPDNLKNYAQTCAKIITDLCDPWIQKLASSFPKSSTEYKTLSAALPETTERSRPNYATTKITQNYHAPDLDQVSFDAAMAIYLEGKYGDSAKALLKFNEEYPRSAFRFRSRFWLAQSYKQDKEFEKAKTGFADLVKETPLTYYGLLSAIMLERPIETRFDAQLPTVDPTDPFLAPLELVRLKRAEQLAASGLFDFATQDLKELKVRDSASNPFLMYLADLNYEVGNYGTAFVILSELISRGYEGLYSTYGLRLVFPVVQQELIEKNCKAIDLDPILALSLMKQESAFDATIHSSSGASGLMQLMPATAVDTESTVKRADLLTPDVNIRVGTKYLKKMLNHFNGNIAMALAAYNAGPGAVDRWIKEGRANKGLLEFVESIPFRETREYVGSIIRNYFWYTKKIKGENLKDLSRFWVEPKKGDETKPQT